MLEDPPPMGLLGIQAEFTIGLLFQIFAAAGQQKRQSSGCQDGRFSLQVTIMSVAAAFWKPLESMEL